MKKASGVSAGLSSFYNGAKWLREVQGKVKEGQRKMWKKYYYYVIYKGRFSEGSRKLQGRSREGVRKVLY